MPSKQRSAAGGAKDASAPHTQPRTCSLVRHTPGYADASAGRAAKGGPLSLISDSETWRARASVLVSKLRARPSRPLVAVSAAFPSENASQRRCAIFASAREKWWEEKLKKALAAELCEARRAVADAAGLLGAEPSLHERAGTGRQSSSRLSPKPHSMCPGHTSRAAPVRSPHKPCDLFSRGKRACMARARAASCDRQSRRRTRPRAGGQRTCCAYGQPPAYRSRTPGATLFANPGGAGLHRNPNRPSWDGTTQRR